MEEGMEGRWEEEGGAQYSQRDDDDLLDIDVPTGGHALLYDKHDERREDPDAVYSRPEHEVEEELRKLVC